MLMLVLMDRHTSRVGLKATSQFERIDIVKSIFRRSAKSLGDQH